MAGSDEEGPDGDRAQAGAGGQPGEAAEPDDDREWERSEDFVLVAAAAAHGVTPVGALAWIHFT